MLNKEDFIKFILADPKGRSAPSTKAAGKKAKPETDALGGYGFGDEVVTPETSATSETTFAKQLLEASEFGPAQYLATSEVILGGDPAAQHLPDKVYYWPKAAGRPYQTILFELTQPSSTLLNATLFKPLKGVLEDALTRLVQDTLKGFEIGGERRKADVKQGKQDETLCVVSIRDERDKESGTSNLICFGTVARGEGSLETFHIREAARFWEPQLAQDHLERLYDRHFKKLASDKWQDAFISGEERKLARKLMDVSHGKKTDESKIQEAVVDLLEEIALSYGLRKKPGGRRLEATDLPQDHDIGIKDGALSKGAKNPFRGMTLRDEKNRLLGYIIYCLDQKEDAEVLRAHLEKNNRFHNVLVVYPNGDSTGLELWQGNKPLQGKLTKRGAKFEGEGQVVNLLSRFFVVSKALVSNPAELAAELAYRARYLRGFALRELGKPELLRDKDLSKLYNSFHDIFLKGEEKGKDKAEVEAKKHDEFADSYAQTLTYGLLSARWISKDDLAAKGERFTLDNAAGLLERTSPFFKELFTQVISQSHDASRDWLLQDITDLLDRIDIDAVFAGVQDDVLLGHDPVMHFYEPFLAAYDAAIKRQRGVFYTPHPVVSYIVRSVDELLKSEFGLEDGLADITTWGEMIKRHPDLNLPLIAGEKGDKKPISPDEPFVIILDPATGTATFLVEVIDVIYRTLVAKWEKRGFTEAKINAAWNEYVPKHLLPRLYGYELIMAPYAIAHLKIGIKLSETGYTFASKKRANVYLTNSLEPGHDFSGRLAFDAPAIAHEAAAVNEIKRHKRFTVVIGNPPYSNYGQLNRNQFIIGLLEDYKRGLGEKKLNLDDDFIKFVRFSQFVIASAGVGCVGMITNNSYLDGVTHRRMRQSLLESFGRISVIDLHGSTKRREVAPDGTPDDNVFDIQQGVSIVVLRRLIGGSRAIQHADLWGTRDTKYSALINGSCINAKCIQVTPEPPQYFLVPKVFAAQHEYDEFYPLRDAVVASGNGLKTERDGITIHFEKAGIEATVDDFRRLNEAAIRLKYGLETDSRDWKVAKAKTDVLNHKGPTFFRQLLYRPFDSRQTWYSGQTRGFIGTPGYPIMKHLLGAKNLALISGRQGQVMGDIPWDLMLCTTLPVDTNLYYRGGNTVFPLYLCDEVLSFDLGSKDDVGAQNANRRPNFTAPFLQRLAGSLQLSQSGAHSLPADLTPEDIFHYAYAVFHSPGYRTRFAEFLKIDFPRLPLPGNLELFRALARLGDELTALHLLESPKLAQPITEFIGGRHPEVGRVAWSEDTVWLDAPTCRKDATQQPGSTGSHGVTETVWNFHIGGYQVCHKWLKDRKDRTLSADDITHYHNIVAALSETIRLMAEIDQVIDQHGGWPAAFQTEAKASNS